MLAVAPLLALNKSLTRLDISGCGLDDLGATAIARSLVNLPALEILSLDSNPIGDLGYHAIVFPLKRLTRLRRLDIFYTDIRVRDAVAQYTIPPTIEFYLETIWF